MRKLLLAGVAVLGASTGLASFAQAQTTSSQASTVSGVGSAPATADDGQATSGPAPGSITVRLNGRFRFYAGYFDDQQLNVGGNKQADYGAFEYARLYPGFDGVAANGLKYGAALEIRQDNAVAPGGGVNGSISSASRASGTLAYRREYGYLGSDLLGTLRFGATDNPSSLYLTGTVENFDGAGWNGDIPAWLSGTAQLTWPFSDVGAMYTTSKIVYLSPQVYGFDLGASYEPSTAADTGDGGEGNCGVATAAPGLSGGALFGGSGVTTVGAGCDRLSSTTVLGETARRRNTTDVLLRYRGTFGPVGVAATGSYISSGSVQNDSTPAGTTIYNGLNLFDTGAAVTYGGLSVQGNYQRGRYNGQWALDVKHGADGAAWIAGATYTVGPLIFGASWIDYVSQGDNTLINVSQRREQGAAAGATYSLAPGIAIFLSYIWDQRKQSGFNFITGADSGATATANNRIRAQALAIGTGLSW